MTDDRAVVVAEALAAHLQCYRMHRSANLLQFSCETVVPLDSPSPEAAHLASVALAALDLHIRVEIVEWLNRPTTCRVWRRGGVLVFNGRDYSADLTVTGGGHDG